MAEKKYYWLKLKRDFFKRHDVRIIEEMPNGKDYILFYLKLLLESIDHEGELRFSDTIPYNEQMLSIITNTNIDIVRAAMKVFVELKMIDIFDDQTIFMCEVQKLVGSETAGAERVRKHRQRVEALQCNVDVTKCNTEIEKEKETEKNTDKEGNAGKPTAAQVVELYHKICVSFPSVRTISDSRKKAIKARLNTYTLEDFETLFKNAEASSFLKGKNPRNWSATFDWLIKDSNMAKVIEGNYADKQPEQKNSSFETDDFFASAVKRSYKKLSPREALEREVAANMEAKEKPKTASDDPELARRMEALKSKIGGG